MGEACSTSGSGKNVYKILVLNLKENKPTGRFRRAAMGYELDGSVSIP
jgi:hypothetical protein